MKLKLKIWDCVAALLFAAALGFLAAGFFGGGSGGDARSTANHVERVLGRRLAKLDKAMNSALKQAPDALLLDNSAMTSAEQQEWLMERFQKTVNS